MWPLLEQKKELEAMYCPRNGFTSHCETRLLFSSRFELRSGARNAIFAVENLRDELYIVSRSFSLLSRIRTQKGGLDEKKGLEQVPTHNISSKSLFSLEANLYTKSFFCQLI